MDLSWALITPLALFGVYILARVASHAYFASKMWYQKELLKDLKQGEDPYDSTHK